MNQKYLPSSVHLLRNVNVKADLYQNFSKTGVLSPYAFNVKPETTAQTAGRAL